MASEREARGPRQADGPRVDALEEPRRDKPGDGARRVRVWGSVARGAQARGREGLQHAALFIVEFFDIRRVHGMLFEQRPVCGKCRHDLAGDHDAGVVGVKDEGFVFQRVDDRGGA